VGNKESTLRAGAHRAFTLVEMVIAVAVIAVLAMMAVPTLLEAQVRAFAARSRADMRTMASALEAYAVDARAYPLNGSLHVDGAMQVPQVTVGAAPLHKFATDALTTPIAYLSALPSDPLMTRTSAPWAGSALPWKLFFYTNLDHFARIAGPTPVPVIEQKRASHGAWILAGAGPDEDRLDLAREVAYDPTNGTLSDGDIILSPRRGGY